jgi:hypothetical protein
MSKKIGRYFKQVRCGRWENPANLSHLRLAIVLCAQLGRLVSISRDLSVSECLPKELPMIGNVWPSDAPMRIGGAFQTTEISWNCSRRRRISGS